SDQSITRHRPARWAWEQAMSGRLGQRGSACNLAHGPPARPDKAMVQAANETELVTDDFAGALARLQAEAMRLDAIWPADDPHTALLTHEGRPVRLTSRPDEPPPPAGLPAFRPGFVLTRAGSEAGEGRAGMAYRDLIPGRL